MKEWVKYIKQKPKCKKRFPFLGKRISLYIYTCIQMCVLTYAWDLSRKIYLVASSEERD